MPVTRAPATFIPRMVLSTLFIWAAAAPAFAQQQPPQPIVAARVIVTGDGSVTVPPDYAQITSGVTTKAKTAKEATDANSQKMTALNAALQQDGIAPNDIQTVRFSVSPVYGPPQPNGPPKLVGFSAANQLAIKVRQIGRVGELLDSLITAGATDAGSVQFLHANSSKALDQARQTAMVDARHKAELYARAAGLTLGPVAWITEVPGYAPPSPMGAMRMLAASPAVPIAAGEDTLQVQITVGFEIAH